MQPNRITPLGPPSAYKTYEIHAPKATHRRKATCAEIDCAAYAFGWVTTVDVSTDLGGQQANYIRLHSGRSFTVAEIETSVMFTFPAGQRCFMEHTVPLERPEIYAVREGDWRVPGEARRHANAENWVDDFANHQQRIADAVREG